MKLTHRFSIVLLALILFAGQEATAQRKKKREAQLTTVVTTAKSYIGTPYKWGGNSRNGIDCSGLIHNSYKAAGIKIPRTAKEQSKYGSSKGWDQIREGDVVTFKFKDNGEKWWHAGIVSQVSTETVKFVHASTSRGVTESDLMSDYYRKNVKRIRRVIK
jgi:cell wall-associated NlpC family hydrolase